MPKCPRCGEEITYLKNIREEVVEYIFELDEHGEEQHIHNDSWEGDIDDYRCPICGQILFTNEEEAIEFLKPKAKQTTLT